MKDHIRRGLSIVLIWAGMIGAAFGQSIVQEFYIPMPEAQIRQSFLILAPATGTILDSVASIVVGGAGTKIVYDHWEDG